MLPHVRITTTRHHHPTTTTIIVTLQATAHTMLDAYVAAGGNFIDTADAYKGGESEAILGRWLAKQDRSQLVIATKVYFGGPGPNDSGLSRTHIMTNVAKSLDRMQTDYIDLYQIHNWDHHTAVEDWLGTFKDLIAAGKIRTYGSRFLFESASSLMTKNNQDPTGQPSETRFLFRGGSRECPLRCCARPCRPTRPLTTSAYPGPWNYFAGSGSATSPGGSS